MIIIEIDPPNSPFLLTAENDDKLLRTKPDDHGFESGLDPAGITVKKKKKNKRPRFIYSLLAISFLVILAYLSGISQLGFQAIPDSIKAEFTPELFIFILAGFIAQMIDGALGMAYGVSATTFLMSFGITPAIASASVHTSEIFTSGVSGLMHLKFGNVNRKLFQTLLLPGIIGAVLGAFVISSLEEFNYILRPAVAMYTAILGVLIIRKAFQVKGTGVEVKNVAPLAIFGGLMDSIGGGGWGPIVSSNLIMRGNHPRFTIGSVNLAEFFVALASSLTFFTLLGVNQWKVIVGLIVGGVIAAPIAATIAKKIPVKSMMILVGIVVILVSFRNLFVSILRFF